MRSFIQRLKIVMLSLSVIAGAHSAQDRPSVVERVRAELAMLLKKDPAKLPTDKPVIELGADELDVVEWVMAIEEAFHIQIADQAVMDPKSKKTRKEFSIASMAAIVMDALKRPDRDLRAAATEPPKAIALMSLKGEQVGFMLTAVKPRAKGEFAGECVFMLLPQRSDLTESELGVLISELKVGGEHACRVLITSEKTEVFVTPAKLAELRVVLESSGAGALSVVKDGGVRKLGIAERAKK